MKVCKVGWVVVWAWGCADSVPKLPMHGDFPQATGGEVPEGHDSAEAGETGEETGDPVDPVDVDADGFAAPEDCDDADPAVHPGAVEVCGNGVDDNCDGQSCRWTGDSAEVWLAQRGDSAGVDVALGDVTGDGQEDVVVGAPDASGGPRAGTVWVVPQVPETGRLEETGFGLGPDAVAEGAGRIVVVPGDLNADGMIDLVVGTQHVPDAAPGRLAVLLGPLAEGMRLDSPDAVVPVPEDLGLQLFVAPGPSVDGSATLLVGAPMEDAGVVRILTGAWEGERPLDTARLQWTASEGAAGRGVAAAGDLDGDGIDDVLIGVPDIDRVAVFLGPHAGGAVEDADQWLAGAGGSLGTTVRGAGDVDGDGRADVLAAESVGRDDRGRVWLFCGAMLDGCAELVGSADDDQLGHDLTEVGDTDGDGFAEVVLAAHPAGAVAVWFGPVVGSHDRGTADAATILDGQAGFSLAGSARRVVAGSPTAGTEDPPAGGIGVIGFPGL